MSADEGMIEATALLLENAPDLVVMARQAVDVYLESKLNGLPDHPGHRTMCRALSAIESRNGDRAIRQALAHAQEFIKSDESHPDTDDLGFWAATAAYNSLGILVAAAVILEHDRAAAAA